MTEPSKTPRTDADTWLAADFEPSERVINAAHAQQMERELAAARLSLSETQKLADGWKREYDSMTRSRNEAEARADESTDYAEELRKAGTALYKWLLTVPHMEPPLPRFSIPDEIFEPFQDALFDQPTPNRESEIGQHDDPLGPLTTEELGEPDKLPQRGHAVGQSYCPHCNPCRHEGKAQDAMLRLASWLGHGPGSAEFTTVEDMEARIRQGVDTVARVEGQRIPSQDSPQDRGELGDNGDPITWLRKIVVDWMAGGFTSPGASSALTDAARHFGLLDSPEEWARKTRHAQCHPSDGPEA